MTPLFRNASGLRRILLVVSPILEESATKIVQGFGNFMSQHGRWDVYWDNELRSLQDESWLRTGGWSGVVSRHTNQLQVEVCHELGIPLVDVNNAKPFRGVPNVELCNVAVGEMGGEHLVEQGFRHFGFFGYRDQVWAFDRRRGFVDALELAGKQCSVLEQDHPRAETPEKSLEQLEEAGAWLLGLPLPAAVMAATDHRARLLIEAADHVGLKVPEDVAILGANDDEVRCSLACPSLSSVGTNHVRSGYLAAKALRTLLLDDTIAAEDLLVEPLAVVVRHSTDVVVVPDERIAKAVRHVALRACKGLTVQDLSAEVGVARTQLEEGFRKYLGRSPQAEIRRVQLVEVRRLLQETDLSIGAIAEQTGFSHQEYLSVFFKREMGETPGRFRRSYRAVMDKL